MPDVESSPEPEFGVLAIGGDGAYRVLQLTDFHNDVDDALTARTYDDIRAMVRRFVPDFLAVTGDIWCGDDKPAAAPHLMRRDLEFLGSLGVPWAFTWGNHDFVGDFRDACAQIAATRGVIAPLGDGRGNFRVELRRPETQSPAWDLYFLNSHTECLLPEDLAWFEAEAERVAGSRPRPAPAIVFTHIPFEQYERARMTGRYIGIAQEEVLFWGNDGSRFDTIRRPGTVRACFVGHSHVNDFYFVERGVVLAYGRATGRGGYGGELLPKGAKLIELDPGSDQFTFQTVFADGTTWRP